MMRYCLNRFSLSTWEDLRANGTKIPGFRVKKT